MYIVGCDFGLVKSGIVVMSEDFRILAQTLLSVKSTGAQRLVDIEAGFDQIIRPYRDDLTVFLEGYAYGMPFQRESLAELGGVMRRYFCVNELDFWVIPPMSNKMFVTGYGKANKNYMKKMTRDKWNIPFKSDDICDAYGLARLGVTYTRVQDNTLALPTLPPEEQTIIKAIQDSPVDYHQRNTAGRGKGAAKKRKS